MPTSFPTTVDSFTNPSSTTSLGSGNPALVHHTQHADANDAITALETKVGAAASTDPTSLDYKIRTGSFLRTTVTTTTALIANAASDTTQTLAIGKEATVLQLVTSAAAWVRLYASTAAQTADSTRLQTVDPAAGAGVLLDVLTTASLLTIVLSPPAIAFSSTGGTTIPITVTNASGAAQAITVTLTLVPKEG
jgi:hypothetical protein